MYQVADMVNGAFGDVYETRDEAEKALAIEIAEGQKINDEWAAETGGEAEDASKFFAIVEVE